LGGTSPLRPAMYGPLGLLPQLGEDTGPRPPRRFMPCTASPPAAGSWATRGVNLRQICGRLRQRPALTQRRPLVSPLGMAARVIARKGKNESTVILSQPEACGHFAHLQAYSQWIVWKFRECPRKFRAYRSQRGACWRSHLRALSGIKLIEAGKSAAR
jgi:hypothetical protein